MKIDTLGIQAFIAIADRGGFQRAADTLHITQTALTRRMQNLEALLEVPLFERTTRSIALTPTGRDFLPQARRLLAELAMALTEIRETGKARRGDVSIACVPSAGVQFLPHVIERYAAQYPHNRIKILDHASAAVADAVLRREAEFGINIAEPDRPELASAPLLEDRFVLICRQDHPLGRNKTVSWKRLQAHRLIFAGTQSNNRPLLDVALSRARIGLQSFYEVQRSSTALGLVAAGVAAAVVPSLALQKDTYPTIRVVALTHPVVTRKLVLISRRNAQFSPAARALHETIREEAARGRWT